MSKVTQNFVQPSQPYHLHCLRCGRVYPATDDRYVCTCRPNVGSDLGTLEVQYDFTTETATQSFDGARLDFSQGIARYAPLLPITGAAALTPLTVGGTPLLGAPRLAAQLTLRNLFIKDDGRNPSGSLKDRASAIAVSRARAAGAPIVATASTGNAAAALASQCAAVGQTNVIFVPQSAPQAKIAQLLAYGSHVVAIDGSYDQAFDLCAEACQAFGWYNRNTGYNPYMTEGKKTVAFEIAEQLAWGRVAGGRWQVAGGKGESAEAARQAGQPQFVAPDAVFVSVGDGCIIGGVHKGFKDLLALGWIDKVPRIYGVQSTQSDALYQAWRNDWDIPQPVAATTRADSISVNAPRDPVKALNAVRQSGGAFLAVPDAAILDAILPMARLGGVFAEPAGATALAGLAAAVEQHLVHADETIVIINTGSGLKDVPAVLQITGGTKAIPPTLEAVYDATKDVGK
jgi:threonine synthase